MANADGLVYNERFDIFEWGVSMMVKFILVYHAFDARHYCSQTRLLGLLHHIIVPSKKEKGRLVNVRKCVAIIIILAQRKFHYNVRLSGTHGSCNSSLILSWQIIKGAPWSQFHLWLLEYIASKIAIAFRLVFHSAVSDFLPIESQATLSRILWIFNRMYQKILRIGLMNFTRLILATAVCARSILLTKLSKPSDQIAFPTNAAVENAIAPEREDYKRIC